MDIRTGVGFMNCSISFPHFFCLTAIFCTAAMADSPSVIVTPATSPNGIHLSRDVKALQGKTGFKLDTQADANDKSLNSSITGMILGKQRSLLNVTVQPTTDLLEGETELYVGSIQVVTSTGKFENGAYSANIAIPPVTARIPVVTLPVGPLTVKLNAGFSLEANLSAGLHPEFAVPIEDSALRAELSPQAKALGFLEGYVSLFILRGGVRGEVTVIDTDTHLGARIALNGTTPPLYYSFGYIDFLSGQVNGFADRFKVWGWRWSRFWQPTLYSWAGTCINLGKGSETVGPCASK